MPNVRIVSTDNELDQELSQLAPYCKTEICVTVSQPGARQSDGSTEHAEPMQESYEQTSAGQELRESAAGYDARLKNFKSDQPDFEPLLTNSNVQISQAVRDEILRAPNGPQIVHFLAAFPEVAQELAKMHPLQAARIVREGIGPDLSRVMLPAEGTDYSSWKAARNPQSSPAK